MPVVPFDVIVNGNVAPMRYPMAVPVGLPMPRRQHRPVDLQPDARLAMLFIAIGCILAGAITALLVS